MLLIKAMHAHVNQSLAATCRPVIKSMQEFEALKLGLFGNAFSPLVRAGSIGIYAAIIIPKNTGTMKLTLTARRLCSKVSRFIPSRPDGGSCPTVIFSF